MDRESFLFYRTYQEAGHRIPEKQRLKFYEMIFEYGLTGTEPEDTGDALIDMALSFIRPLIRANIRNYANGCKGGAPSESMKGNQNARKNTKQTENKPKSNPKQTENKGNDKEKDNVKGNVKDNDKDKVNDKDNVNVNDKEINMPSAISEGEVDYDEMSWFDRLEDDRDKE